MVNALNNTLWVVDTVDADVIDDKNMRVKSIRWIGGATSAAAEAVVIRDPTTNTTLWETTASGANYVEESLYNPPLWWVNGFEVPTLDNGTLYITLA
ncbi:hypothetical protein LCGC14_0690210 [marine sediment metagenome]|uniref:Uncharacterized protein n=1 Tax=marine sediment metagenome TaxID=412755 RepID=A0A0F9R634_9ZZZZ|nr:hypothetical protein [Candidatus Aminicenantes bacterium]